MTADEARQVLAYMANVWPNTQLDEPQVAVWLETLAPMSPAHARAAARTLKAQSQFFPSHALFLETAAAIRRAQEHADSATRGLPVSSERVSPDAFRAGLEAARATLPRRGATDG